MTLLLCTDRLIRVLWGVEKTAYMGSTSVRQSVCELMSAIKPFVRFCEIRWPGSWHQVLKKRLFCAYRLIGSRLSAVCLSVCLSVCLGCHNCCPIVAQFVTRDPRTILLITGEFRENGRSGSGALLAGVNESTTQDTS